jgi:hypothetical protein
MAWMDETEEEKSASARRGGRRHSVSHRDAFVFRFREWAIL